jgi:RNA polymerase sigma-70 factor (ECF subfamily)
MNDEQLIRQFLDRRDERAFRRLYTQHTPAVYGLIRRLAGPRIDLADDVLQETWLRAASTLARFRGESAFRTWLTGIALNCYRERTRRSMGPSAYDPPGPPIDSISTGLEVGAVLDALSTEHREVLVLHDVEGYTHEEIANALGIEIGTSKSRLSRARAMFRAHWRQPFEAQGASR